ncbi:hypothetical protein OY671_010720, partial [Metschnikowia pulcherrima]
MPPGRGFFLAPSGSDHETALRACTGHRPAPKALAMVSIATWNINSVRSRIDQVERFSAEQAPDVSCLQEIKTAEESFPHEMFERSGYTHRAVHGQKG